MNYKKYYNIRRVIDIKINLDYYIKNNNSNLILLTNKWADESRHSGQWIGDIFLEWVKILDKMKDMKDIILETSEEGKV